MNKLYTKIIVTAIIILSISVTDITAQQFNTDNYVTMPWGTGTFIITTGQRDAMMYSVFSLAPNFEFNFQANLFWKNNNIGSTNRFTTNIYGKYTFWINKQKTGGAAVFLGVGKSPSYYSGTGYSDMHRNFWTAVPVTIPLFNNTLSWDIMPGALVDLDYGSKKTAAWGFTYSSRLAIYKIIPKTAIVGEIYGTTGEAESLPEFKAGFRWEPNYYIVVAATYGSQLNGNNGTGFELGIMIFTPQFLRRDYIKNNR